MTLGVQFITFFTMLACGAGLGILFDLYRVVSRPFKLNRLTFSLFDIIYWLIAMLIVFTVLVASNDGELRFFIFVSLLLGTWLYFRFISSYIVIAIKHVMRWVKKLVDIAWRCFNIFVIKPIKIIYKLFMILFGFCAAVTMYIYNLVIQCLQWIKRLYDRLFK